MIGKLRKTKTTAKAKKEVGLVMMQSIYDGKVSAYDLLERIDPKFFSRG